MAKKESQNDKILRYLKSHESGITPMDALDSFSCFRLSGRIKDLRTMGYSIKTERVEVINKYGQKCRVARYTLVE